MSLDGMAFAKRGPIRVNKKLLREPSSFKKSTFLRILYHALVHWKPNNEPYIIWTNQSFRISLKAPFPGQKGDNIKREHHAPITWRQNKLCMVENLTWQGCFVPLWLELCSWNFYAWVQYIYTCWKGRSGKS